MYCRRTFNSTQGGHSAQNHEKADPLLVLLPIITLTYLITLTSIAVDRAVAVLRPFYYKQSPKRTAVVVLCAIISGFCLSIGTYSADIFFDLYGVISRDTSSAVIVLSFTTLFTSYSLIVYKLRAQQRGRVASKHATHIPDENHVTKIADDKSDATSTKAAVKLSSTLVLYYSNLNKRL